MSDEVTEFYNRGLEHDRLAGGVGALEFARTQQILERHLPSAPATIADIGGGPGRYAVWLAERGLPRAPGGSRVAARRAGASCGQRGGA